MDSHRLDRRPRWLRPLTSARSFLIVYGLLGTLQTMCFMYFNITLTTLERRFRIPSGTTGWVLSGNEVSQILLSLVLSYWGGRRHRPRWIALGGAASAASCFVLVAIHGVYGAGEEALKLTKEWASEHVDEVVLPASNGWNSSATATAVGTSTLDNLCRAAIQNISAVSTTTSTCRQQSSALFSAAGDTPAPQPEALQLVPLVLIFISQFVLGIGTTLYYTLGLAYLDDTAGKTGTPMRMALAFALRMFGVVLSFGLIGWTLRKYIDPWRTPLIEWTDPRWLGAWWLGWLMMGAAMAVLSLAVAAFPRELRPERRVATSRSSDEQDAEDGADEAVQKLNREELQKVQETAPYSVDDDGDDFWSALLRLLRNKLIMFNIVANIFYVLGSSAYLTYVAKYFEVQFNRASVSSTLFAGPAFVGSMMVGCLVSGWVIQRWRPTPRQLFAYGLLVGVAGLGGKAAKLLLVCEPGTLVDSVGSHIVGIDGSSSFRLGAALECSGNCSCDGVRMEPVCDELTGRSYFSPCQAGCAEWDAERKRYGGCSCGGWGASAGEGAPDGGGSYTMKPGACVAGCATAFLVYNLLACVTNWLGASAKIGNVLLSMR